MPRTGRPEQPLDTNGPIAPLAGELRRLRDHAELTYLELAADSDLSVATLRAAASGTHLPTWNVTRAFVSACGGDQDIAWALWADGCRAVGRDVPARPPVYPPDPGRAASAADLISILKELRLWANNPSLSDLNKRAGGHNLLPKSTLSDMLTGDQLPPLERMLTFVRACDQDDNLDDNQLLAWENAWERLKAQEKGLPTTETPSSEINIGATSRVKPRHHSIIQVIGIATILTSILSILTVGQVINWKFTKHPVAMSRTCTKSGPVVFTVSGRQDSPAPTMTPEMRSAAITAAVEGSATGVVDLDGRPRLATAATLHRSNGNIGPQPQRTHFVDQLTSAVTGVRADHPHANVLRALDVAAQAIRAACPHGGTIYLEDSGLQDVPPIDFRQVINSSPIQVMASLIKENQIPHLGGINVVLVGLGETAAPQPALSSTQQANVLAIWKALIKAGGANSVEAEKLVHVEPAPTSAHAVAKVPVTDRKISNYPSMDSFWRPSSHGLLFSSTGPVGFIKNTAQFQNYDAAQESLTLIAQYLSTRPAAQVNVWTPVDSGNTARNLTLSYMRSIAVSDILGQLGVENSRVSAQGPDVDAYKYSLVISQP